MDQTEGSEPSPLRPPAGSRPSPAGVGPGGHRAPAAAAGGGGGPGHVPHKTPLAALGPACPHCFPRPPCAAAWPWLGASALPASAGEQLGTAPRTVGAGLHPAASSSSPLVAPPRGNQDFPTRVCTKPDFPFPRCTTIALFPSLLLLLFPSPRAGQVRTLSPPPRMRVSLLSPLLLLSFGCSRGSAELPAARAKCPTRCDVSKCPSPSCPSGYVPDRCNCCLICAAGEGDSCGRKEDPPCGDSLDCRYPMGKRFAKGVCQCKLSAQVCGSDGRTYDNVCQLKAVSRKALQHGLPAVAQVQKGACESGRSMAGSAWGGWCGECCLTGRNEGLGAAGGLRGSPGARQLVLLSAFTVVWGRGFWVPKSSLKGSNPLLLSSGWA